MVMKGSSRRVYSANFLCIDATYVQKPRFGLPYADCLPAVLGMFLIVDISASMLAADEISYAVN